MKAAIPAVGLVLAATTAHAESPHQAKVWAAQQAAVDYCVITVREQSPPSAAPGTIPGAPPPEKIQLAKQIAWRLTMLGIAVPPDIAAVSTWDVTVAAMAAAKQPFDAYITADREVRYHGTRDEGFHFEKCMSHLGWRGDRLDIHD